MSGPGPYRTVLGEAFTGLPPAVRALHGGWVTTATGRADVEHGRSLLAGALVRLLGLPPAGEDQPLRVRIEPSGDGERWTREYGRTTMRSRQRAVRIAGVDLLAETLGLVTALSALSPDSDGLRLRLRGWRLAGVPMPLAWGPRVEAREFEADGRYGFDIALSHPFTGLLVRYRGWLAPSQPPGARL